MLDDRTAKAAALYIIFDVLSAGVKNKYFSLKESAHNAFSHDRRFADMQEATGYVQPTTFFDNGYSMSALWLLKDENNDANVRLSASPLRPDTDEYRISASGITSYRESVELIVSGDTTNGDFYKLCEAIKTSQTPSEAIDLLIDTAREQLGAKLQTVNDMREKASFAPQAIPGA